MNLENNVMNPQQLALYQKIQAFALDKPNVYFTYSQRLARDHQWSSDYTQRVIEEYKKFLFLAIAAGHPVTPSVAVDEAWHLHLTYTRSYWDELCGQVLGKYLHHHPTQGGQQQRQLFENYYAQTLESYQQFFGCPPDDIWPSPTRRFNPAEQIRQINQKDYWLIPKPSLMSLPQILGRFSQNVWLKGIVTFLLMFGLVVSLSPAIAQVSSSSDQISLFKILQKWLLDHPFVSFCIVVSGISFLIGFILSLKPIFIQPVGKTEILYGSVELALFISAFFLTILWLKSIIFYFFSFLNFWFLPWIILFLVVLWIILNIAIFRVEIVFIRKLSKIEGKTLHPFYCLHCIKKLKMLASLSCFLNEQEQVAQQIGSTTFEAWHCQNCYPEINSQSIHLQFYSDTSNQFKKCSVCQEVTMTKNSQTLRRATAEKEGTELITYTCQCCHKKEEKTQIIPRVQDSGCDSCCC